MKANVCLVSLLNRIYPFALVAPSKTQRNLIDSSAQKFSIRNHGDYTFENISDSSERDYKSITFKSANGSLVTHAVPCGSSSSTTFMGETDTIKRHLSNMMMDHVSGRDICLV